MRLRHFLLEFSNCVGCADAGDNVFTLSIDEVFTVEYFFTVCRVTSESNTSCASITHIAEDHGLNINSGAPCSRDAVFLAVERRTLVLP